MAVTPHHIPLSERSGTERMILEDIANALDDLVYAENEMLGGDSSDSEQQRVASQLLETGPKRLLDLQNRWIEWQGIKDRFQQSLSESRQSYDESAGVNENN